MSWLETPVKFVPALNRLCEVIIERYNYMCPAAGAEYEPGLKLLSVPTGGVKSKIIDVRRFILHLYTYHFPVKNFGTWGHWRPFDKLEYEDPKVIAAVEKELIEAGIDPAYFIKIPRQVPHRLSDGNFVRACYHLLNNVILFSVDGIIHRDVLVHSLKWNSDAAYDSNMPYVDEMVSGGSYSGAAAVGYCKSTLECSLIRDFYQQICDRKGRRVSPELLGKWKGRYTTRIWKQLLYPLTSDAKEQEDIRNLTGFTEISFTGVQSDTTLPWCADITRDLAYYKTWGDYKYYYSISQQRDTLAEVMLNVENFPPHNYKYLD